MRRGDILFKLYINSSRAEIMAEMMLGTLRIITRDYHGHQHTHAKYGDPPLSQGAHAQIDRVRDALAALGRLRECNFRPISAS